MMIVQEFMGLVHGTSTDLPVGGRAEVIGIHPHATGRTRRLPELPVVGDVDRALHGHTNDVSNVLLQGDLAA